MKKMFERAKKVIPGGVNSPVRAFGNVGIEPIFIKKAEKAYIYDTKNKKYIDYVGSWGPMILGHSHDKILKSVIDTAKKGLSFGAATEAEVEMAELICKMVPEIDMVRMVNSGTEAVMSALRVARGFTKRSKIIKFAGCYHGHTDSMLVKAGSGVMTAGIPDSAGVTEGVSNDTLTAVYNDIDSVKVLFANNKDQIAALIVEPVAANMGLVLPKDGFLQALRDVCTENGALLIFDEVITGFRLSKSGAIGKFGIKPDLVTYGKIIGGGMPVGAYGGRRDIMEMVAPLGPVYQAGTLSGNPVAMAAGIEQLKTLNEHGNRIYEKLEMMGNRLASGLREVTKGKGCTVTNIGSLCCLFFTDEEINNYEDAKKADTKRYAEYFAHMLHEGIYLAPAQFEAAFISYAHTDELIDKTIEAAKKFFN